MNGDNPLWYDCDEEIPPKKTSAKWVRLTSVFVLLVAAYVACRFLF
jgi:hypothetical protein